MFRYLLRFSLLSSSNAKSQELMLPRRDFEPLDVMYHFPYTKKQRMVGDTAMLRAVRTSWKMQQFASKANEYLTVL
jgi:hypothetical protein